MPSGPRGEVIVVPMVTGQRVQLSTTHTLFAGEVRVRAKTNGVRTINFGDVSNDMDTLSDGDAVVLSHPRGVDLFYWWATGTTGDDIRILHGGGF
jgi:hypothetical protein